MLRYTRNDDKVLLVSPLDSLNDGCVNLLIQPPFDYKNGSFTIFLFFPFFLTRLTKQNTYD
jgi:hypothetical protein